MSPTMNSTRTQPVRYEFCFPERDTLVQVEVAGEGVTVRDTRDTFSELRRISFVRELAAEGFIGDNYRWFSQVGPESYLGVNWLVDYSWLVIPPQALATARRFTLRLLAFGLVFWLGQMAVLFAR